MKPKLAIIIPCLNEAETLPRLLRGLAAQKNVALDVVAVDGGSTDNTVNAARAGGVRVITTERGRARQMNAGARETSADWLLFLHADSRTEDPALLANALRAVREQANALDHQRVAGHFALKFNRRNGDHKLAWRYVEEKTAFNRPYCSNGDQGLLLSRRYFEELGGFDERLPLLEDQRIAARIRETGVLFTLPGQLRSSARRFEQAGFHRQYLLMALIMAMHAAGSEDFFRQAPDIYRAQHETQRLRLMPFFRLALDCARRADRGKTWLQIGRLGRENWWQLFYFLDIALQSRLGPDRYPCLRFYERLIEPYTTNRLCDGFAASVLWLHFHLVVLPWAWWQDRKSR
ncbi:MAG: TIGR04283 family arsenosugar biosynthesis glycosyltransferase [Nevskiales bacterium]